MNQPQMLIMSSMLIHQGQTLLGKRLNRPAKGFWFVPGGRILKGESMAEAFKRLTQVELGNMLEIRQANLLGTYDHFYQNNVFDDKFTTHYVVIAYVLMLDKELTNLPLNIQHGGYEWFNISDLLKDACVHIHTKNYFV